MILHEIQNVDGMWIVKKGKDGRVRSAKGSAKEEARLKKLSLP